MRQLILDAGWMGKRKHMIHGFIEVDVTHPRRLIQALKDENGRKLSFSAFVLACIGQAINEDKTVQAMRDWRNRLICFEDVDVLITIEIPTKDGPFPLIHPLRAINHRTAWDIHNEIRSVQSSPVQSEGMQSSLMRWFYWLPTFGRHLLYRIVEKSPHLRKKYSGTVGFTSVGMFGSRGGWGLGMPIHPLAITLGGISTKQEWIDGRLQPREYLHVTLSFDHDTIDGAPAARFTNTFQNLIETGYGLEEIIINDHPNLINISV